MATKHQTKCYRVIKGIEYTNYCDLIMGNEENAKAIQEAKAEYKHVKVIKHWTKEYYQLFVAN